MPRVPRMSLNALALACTLVWAATAAAAPPRLGFLLDDARAEPLEVASEEFVRLEVRWGEIEHVVGAYDWTAVSPRVDALRRAGYRTVLALGDRHPRHAPDRGPAEPFALEALEPWVGFVRSAARTFAGRVDVLELGGGPHSAAAAQVDALALKQAALAARAELGARGASARIAQGALEPGALEAQRELWRRDLAAYVDILPVWVTAAPGAADAAAAAVQEAFRESLAHPPAAELWAYVRGGSGWEPVGSAVSALAAGAAVALYRPADDEQVAWTVGLQRTLAEGYAPSAGSGLTLRDAARPDGVPGGVLGRFFNEQDFTTLVVVGATAEASEPVLATSAGQVRDVRSLEPATGRTRRVRNSPAAQGGGREIQLEAAAAPQAVLFRALVVSPGLDFAPEEVAVEATRGLTAEEIIARYQLLQRDQDDHLERWTATGRTDFHFKLAQGGSTVDITIESHYFWERGGQLEWEQTSYFINGNKVRWKNIPELPLIQPEKVITLPLDLTLDRTYVYRLAGEERVDGREAYVIAFEPAAGEPQASLYQGRVWIDKESFARLKAAVVQGNLSPPVLSNEEVDRFRAYPGPDGRSYWMFSDIDGQQVWNAAGRTFVVQRELTFTDFEINPPRDGFDERRRRAYASGNQMLRDTDEGFRYLERQADGSRTVKQSTDTSQLFAAAGAFKDSSRDNVVPLAGVNYFNYDLWGKKIQFNALFAGVFAFVTGSKPALGGSRIDLTADAVLNALELEERVFEGDTEVEEEQIGRRAQNVALRLGVPAGQFVKFSFVGSAAFQHYSDSDDGRRAIAAYNLANGAALDFALPEDHVQLTGGVEAEFNRRGYNLNAEVSRARRSDWQPWGLVDTASGDFGTLVGGMFVPVPGGAPVEPVEDGFTRWSVGAVKEWYLPRFQKIRGGLDYLDGSQLDRFSRYQFSFFGEDRLSGFSGTGVRFDEGAIARLGYAFNLFEIFRLDAAVETARVEQDGSTAGKQSFTGLGLSGNFVGPWKTIININYGYALGSDIPELEGEQEFLLLVFKLF